MLREAVKKMHEQCIFQPVHNYVKSKNLVPRKNWVNIFTNAHGQARGGRGYSLVESPKKVFPNHHQYLHEKSIFFYSLQKQIPVNALIPVKGAMIIFLPGGIVPPWWLT